MWLIRRWNQMLKLTVEKWMKRANSKRGIQSRRPFLQRGNNVLEGIDGHEKEELWPLQNYYISQRTIQWVESCFTDSDAYCVLVGLYSIPKHKNKAPLESSDKAAMSLLLKLWRVTSLWKWPSPLLTTVFMGPIFEVVKYRNLMN